MGPSDQPAEGVASAIRAIVAASGTGAEVWHVEPIPVQGLVRVLIDHPDGVDLGLCERITRDLAPVREQWALEVSSPGLERPLVEPAHFERYVGSTVRVRLREPVDGRRTFTGTLTSAVDGRIAVDVEGTLVEARVDAIAKSNVVWKPVNA